MRTLEVIFTLLTLLSMMGMSLAIRHDKWVLSVMATWAVAVGVLSSFNFFENTSSLPPRFVFILFPSSVLVLLAYRRLKRKRLTIPWLIAVHIIRIPVELVLWELFHLGLVPKLMTFQGWNFDVISGVTAIAVLLAYLANRLPRWLFLLWNGVCLTLLMIIVVSAILSAPTPIQHLAFEQPNMAVIRFPFTWLPAVIVPIVFLSHLLLFTAIRKSPIIYSRV